MDIARNELAGGAAVAVGDRDHQALLHRHHISEVRMVLQRMHDRQLGGPGIAEQMRDALVLEQREKGGTAGDLVLHVSSRSGRCRKDERMMAEVMGGAQGSAVMAALRMTVSCPGRDAAR